MSLGGYKSSSPGARRLPSPTSYSDWIARDFPEDLFLDSDVDNPLHLTPEEEKLFRSFGDGLSSSFGFSSEPDPFDERQAVYAEAQAAGLYKGGIRRAAFSMGDLQALQPEHRSPPSPTLQPSASASGVSKVPRLESVPESKALPSASSSQLLGEDLLLNSRVSGLSVGGGLSEGTLDGLALDQLSTDLLGDSPPCAFDPQLPVSMYEEAQPQRQPLRSVPQSAASSRGSEPLAGMPPLPMPLQASQNAAAVSSSAATSSSLPGIFDYPMMNGAAERKPPLPPTSSTSYSPMVDSKSVMALRGYADELLGSAMPGIPQVPQELVKKPPLLRPDLSEGGGGSEDRNNKERERERMLRRSQSAVELRSMGGTLPRMGSGSDLLQKKQQFTVELTTPEGHIYTAGRLSNEERAQKILRYRQKRHERNFNKRIKYMCRKTLADSRPRVRGRFARNDDAAAVMPHETKKALAEKARKEKKATAAALAAAARQQRSQMGAAGPDGLLMPESRPPFLRQGPSAAGGGPPGFPAVPMELYGATFKDEPL